MIKLVLLAITLQLLLAAATAELHSEPPHCCRPGWTTSSSDGMCYKEQSEDSNMKVIMQLFLFHTSSWVSGVAFKIRAEQNCLGEVDRVIIQIFLVPGTNLLVYSININVSLTCPVSECNLFIYTFVRSLI